jgi:hypothetical protein
VLYSMSMPRSATSRAGTIVVLAAIVAAAGPAWAGRDDPGDARRAASARTVPTVTAVAVVDLTGSDDGRALARAVQGEISRSASLRATPEPIAAALTGELVDEDAAAVAEARRVLGEARDAVAHFERPTALRLVGSGVTRVLGAAPSPDAVRVLADLLFTEGLAHAADGDIAAATLSFAAVRRLDPARTIDPQTYLPDVVRAFAAGGRAPSARASLAVRVPGGAADAGTEVWIDGVHAGAAPVAVPVAPGPHVVSITGPALASTGVRVTAAAGRVTPVEISAQRVPAAQHASRLRRAIAGAADEPARNAALAALAEAIAVDQIAVVVAAERGPGLRVWKASTGLGGVHANDGRVPAGVLPGVPAPEAAARLAARGPRRLGPRSTPGRNHEDSDERPWYRRRWVQASVIGGALAVAGAVTAVALTSGSNSSTLGPVETD